MPDNTTQTPQQTMAPPTPDDTAPSAWQCVLRRIPRVALLVIVVAGATALWLRDGPGPDWQHIRNACYIAGGGFVLVTAVYPLAGVLLLSFCVPLLSAVPLYLSRGDPYPIVLFAGIGFIIGWLLREVLQPREYRFFRGQGWLLVFVALFIISGLATFLRYHPTWVWSAPRMLAETVNHKGMTRGDAARYVIFVFANGLLGVLVVCAVYGIVSRYRHLGCRVETMVLWAVLLGGACAAGFAVHQALNNIHLCANKSYYWTRLRRVNGTCTDPNALGAFISLCVTVSFLKIIFSGSWKSPLAWLQRIAAALVTALYVFGIQYSGSRSALLGALLGGAAVVLTGTLYHVNILARRWRAPVVLRIIVAILAIGACAGGVVCLPKAIDYMDRRIRVTRASSSLMRRLKRDFRLFRRDGSVLGMIKDRRRLLYWRYARAAWKDYPFSGIGLGAYVIELPNYASAARERLYRTDNACNYYLHYGAELGTPAIVFLGLFYASLLLWFVRSPQSRRRLNPAQRHSRIVLAIALPAYLIILVFGVHTLAYEVNIAFAVFLGLVAANHEAVLPPRKARRPWLNYAVLIAVAVIIGLYVWRVRANNRDSLNCERCRAVCGLRGDTGWYKWEKWPGIPFRHRWMGKTASMTIERKNLVVGIPIGSNNPHLPTQPQTVSFFLNGRKAAVCTLDQAENWKVVKFPVPYADAFQHASAPCASIRLEVDRTWMPKQITGADDVRHLGVAVGEPKWFEPSGDLGGWYGPERWSSGMPFRWSKKYAWEKVLIPTNHQIRIPMFAGNLLLRRWPLDVAIYFNRQYCDTVTFRTKGWKNYTYPLPINLEPGTTGILEFTTSRTWIPKHYGFDDSRALGIAVGEITGE